MCTYYLVASAKESRVARQVKVKNSHVAWYYYHSYYFLHSWPIVYCRLMSFLNTYLLYIGAFFNLIFNFIFKIRVIQWLGLCQKAHVEIRSSCLCVMPLLYCWKNLSQKAIFCFICKRVAKRLYYTSWGNFKMNTKKPTYSFCMPPLYWEYHTFLIKI